MAVVVVDVNLDTLELPPMPIIAQQVLEAVNNPETGLARVADLVQQDPVLAGTVLACANSAAYSGVVRVQTLLHAIGRLGMRQVADVAVAASLRPKRTRPEVAEAVQRVWSHAVATAAWARAISIVRRRQVETPFLCGLFHSVGKLVLLQTVELPKKDLEALITRRHVAVGARVAAAWTLPAVVHDAIRYNAAWRTAPANPEACTTVWAATRFANESVGVAEPDLPALEDDAAFDELDLYPDQVALLRSQSDTIAATVGALS